MAAPGRRLAIIPARGGSKRLPRKNILPLLGRPVVTYPLASVRESGLFDRIVVSTEDAEIAALARGAGAEIIDRPPALATDESHELDVARHVLGALAQENYRPDAFCLVYPTAVFLTPEDFQKSVLLLDGPPAADVVISASAFNYHPYKTLARNEAGYWQAMFPEQCRQRSQFYPVTMASNGTFYWLRTDYFLDNAVNSYYVDRLATYELPAERAWDIDEPADFTQAERWMRFQQNLNQ